jgi:GR25 family glycosyltransferase involved in LPS biosynthesis
MLYEEDSVGVFILVTALMGTGAMLSGRAIAATWRPGWQIVAYMLILGAAARFLHFALFGGTLLTPYYYTVDTAICVAFGFLGFRLTRATQMVTQYHWLNERAGPLVWRRHEEAPRRADSG